MQNEFLQNLANQWSANISPIRQKENTLTLVIEKLERVLDDCREELSGVEEQIDSLKAEYSEKALQHFFGANRTLVINSELAQKIDHDWIEVEFSHGVGLSNRDHKALKDSEFLVGARVDIIKISAYVNQAGIVKADVQLKSRHSYLTVDLQDVLDNR